MKEISFRRKHIETIFLFGLLCTFLMRPTHVQGSWTSGGPYGGDINCLAMAANPDVIYAGTEAGVYKTADGGNNWTKTGFSEISVRVVDVAPDDSNRLYAGTDDGIYRSEDGGTTWSQKRLSGARVNALAIDHLNPLIVYAGTGWPKKYKTNEIVGIFKSTDGGETWQDTLSEELDAVMSLLVDTDNASHIYAGIYPKGSGAGLLKSTNGGAEWVSIRVVPTYSSDGIVAFAMTHAGANPPVIFAVDATVGDLFKSTDRGASWTGTNTPSISSASPWGLAIDPNNPETVYVGTYYDKGGFYKSTDGGNTWSIKTNGLPPVCPSSIVIDARNGAIYAGLSESGVYKSTDGAENWKSSSKGIAYTRIEDIAVHPVSSSTIFSTIRGDGYYMATSNNGGKSWDYLPGSSADLGAVVIDPHDPYPIWVGDGAHSDRRFYVYKSINRGESWEEMQFMQFTATTATGISDILVKTDDPNTLLVSMWGWDGILARTTDGGLTWHKSNSEELTPGFTALAADPNNPNVVYSGTHDGAVIRSTVFGAPGTWTDIGSPGGQAAVVREMDVDLNSRVYVAAATGLWRQDGSVWIKMPGLPTDDITALAIDRDQVPEIIYVGTGNDGVFVSQDGGATWISFNGSFPNLPITKLRVSATHPKMLYAGTGPGGVWQISLSPPGDVSGDGGVGLEDAVLVLQILSMTTRSEVISIGGDVNGDGKIGLEEGIYVLQKTAELRD